MPGLCALQELMGGAQRPCAQAGAAEALADVLAAGGGGGGGRCWIVAAAAAEVPA